MANKAKPNKRGRAKGSISEKIDEQAKDSGPTEVGSMFKRAVTRGRPPAYTKVTLVEALIEFFDNALKLRTMPTKASMLLWLGVSRETWSNYHEKEDLLDTIKAAEFEIENAWNQKLANPGATGSIFYLKNAFKDQYKDRTHMGLDGGEEGEPIRTVDISKPLQKIYGKKPKEK